MSDLRGLLYDQHNQALRREADREMAAVKANTFSEICKRWIPVLTVVALLSGGIISTLGFGIGALVYYLKHNP